jgi:hypothetical protein
MDLMTIFQSITLLDIVKLLIILLLMVYTLFAMLMMRQVSAMTRAVAMRDDFVIRVLGILNFGFAIFVLLLAIFIL